LQYGDEAVVRVPESSCKSEVQMGLSGKGEDQLERQDAIMGRIAGHGINVETGCIKQGNVHKFLKGNEVRCLGAAVVGELTGIEEVAGENEEAVQVVGGEEGFKRVVWYS
jgi:hypothetical protein